MEKKEEFLCPVNCPFLALRSFLPNTMPFFCSKYNTFLGISPAQKPVKYPPCRGKQAEIISLGLSLLETQNNSVSELKGTAHIYKYCEDSRSGIEFSALADENAKIIFRPQQNISAIPECAAHSANIAHYTAPQIEYLHQSGLTDSEIHNILSEAFLNDTDLLK